MHKRLSILVVILAFVIALPQAAGYSAPAVDPAAPLTISNFTNGDAISYDLPLLKGTAPGSSSLTIYGNGWSQPVTVNDGRWRAFVLLKPGANSLSFVTSGGLHYSFTLHYSQPANPRKVRIVYVIGSDSTGEFDAPTGAPHSQENAIRRLKVAGRMLQSMTAELLYEKGLPRRTFQLVTDSNGEPVVEVAVVPRTVAELRSMTDQSLWAYFYSELSDIPDRDKIKDIAITGDTHYDPTTHTLQAHMALGTDRLGLFGSATLYTWPETISEIESHFTDTIPIPPEVFPEYARMDGFWATYTTSLGAVLHEFGHCLGLAHPENPGPGDIMVRGFDFLNRLVVTYEPGFGNINPEDSVSPPVIPEWTDADVPILQTNPWLQIADSADGSGGPVSVPGKLSVTPGEVTFQANFNMPGSMSQEVKINLSWPDAGWTAQVNDQLAIGLNKNRGGAGDSLTLTVNTSGYEPGQYSGSVIITASDNTIDGSPLIIPVTLNVIHFGYMIYLPFAVSQ